MNILSVAEVSEIMDRSKTTIYTYLKKGKLKGVKNNGVWQIHYPKGELNNNKIINKDVYINELQEEIRRCEVIEKEIKEIGKKELDINREIMKARNKVNLGGPKPKTISAYLKDSQAYRLIIEVKKSITTKLEETIDSHNEFEDIIEGIDFLDVTYSNTTESIYVNLQSSSIAEFLNKLSEVNKRFFIINNEFMSLSSVKIRFSNHIPDYYKEETMSIMRDNRKVDIIVPFRNLEKSVKLTPKLQSEADKKAIREIRAKIEIAKEYSSVPIKDLTVEELKDYDKLSSQLLSNNRAKNIGFVKSLHYKKVGIRNALRRARVAE